MAEPPTPPDDLFARGLAAGRRAVLRELFGVLDPFARELDGQGARGTARFAPGVDPARLDRFLAATSGKKREIESSTASEPSGPQAPILGISHLRDRETPETRPHTSPQTFAEPVIDAERVTSPSESTQANSDVADFVKQRGMEWWEKSKLDDFDPLVRAEARSIAAELFELAEELRRGDHLR